MSTSVPLAWAAAGTITEFPLPTSGSQLQVITTGRGDKVWFTESAGNKIGQIATK